MLQVTGPVLTNQSALFKTVVVVTPLWNLFMTLTPDLCLNENELISPICLPTRELNLQKTSFVFELFWY